MNNIQTLLAEFVVRSPESTFDRDVVEAAKRAIVDAVASIIAGTTSELAEPLRNYVDRFLEPGARPVLGTRYLLSADKAALTNAMFGHSMDFDDTVSVMPGHPGVVIVSALFSNIPPDGVSGRDFLASFIVGYEVATKLGASIGMGHYDRGWHSTGTMGVFGAFAAVAHLLQLDVEAVVRGFGIVTSMASGLRINFGTMTKPLHSGWAASSATVAAQLASTGFTGHANAMFGKDGFFSAYGTEASAPEELLATLGNPFTLTTPGIALKKYPCCYALHRAIDALETIRSERQLDPTTVRSVTVRVAPGALKPVPYSRPTTGFEGRFSMQYVLAVGILDGDFGMEAFTDEAVNRPAIRSLFERVQAVEDPACSPGDPEGRSASAGTRGFVEVAVEMQTGETVTRVVTQPPGSPTRPLSWDQLSDKFHACVARTALGTAKASRALTELRGLEDCGDVRSIVGLLSSSEAPSGGPSKPAPGSPEG